MTIVYKTGSMFDSEAECIVNATNSVGVMGGGLARAFMDNYPTSCKLYNDICRRLIEDTEELVLMDPWINPVQTDKWHIMMFATKIHYANASRLEYIVEGMPKAVELLQIRGIKSCAWPLLGTGLGGLKVDDVLPVMIENLEKFDGVSEIWTYK